MEKLLRKVIWLTVLAVLFFSFPALGFADQADRESVAFEEPNSHQPVICIRELCSVLGGEVAWNGAARTVTMRVYGSPDLLLDLNEGTLNKISLLPQPYIRDGRTFAPLKPLAEALGATLVWDGRAFYLCPKSGPSVKIRYTYILGSYTITFSTGEARTGNFANACRAGQYLDGKIVPPGGILSFNAAVGPRTTARGFISGIVFSGDDKVTEIGGGVCRAATLLHNAVLAAGLQVVERHRHSQPVTYVPPGRDATVYYGVLDYRFRNNRPDLIRLEFKKAGSSIAMTIWQLG